MKLVDIKITHDNTAIYEIEVNLQLWTVLNDIEKNKENLPRSLLVQTLPIILPRAKLGDTVLVQVDKALLEEMGGTFARGTFVAVRCVIRHVNQECGETVIYLGITADTFFS